MKKTITIDYDEYNEIINSTKRIESEVLELKKSEVKNKRFIGLPNGNIMFLNTDKEFDVLNRDLEMIIDEIKIKLNEKQNIDNEYNKLMDSYVFLSNKKDRIENDIKNFFFFPFIKILNIILTLSILYWTFFYVANSDGYWIPIPIILICFIWSNSLKNILFKN
jgi:hypothetical protein